MTQGRVVFDRLQNQQGSIVPLGSTVVLDIAHDSSFITSTTANDKRVLGVTAYDIAVAAIGLVQVSGICTALVDGAVVRGNWLAQGTTAGKLHDTGIAAGAAVAAPTGACAIALQAIGIAGSISVILLPTLSAAGAGVTAKYNPDTAPAAPSATDDEFAGTSLAGAWTSEAPTVLDATLDSFVRIEDTSGAVKGIWEAYVPGAAAFTVVCKMHGNVSAVGSAQILLSVETSAPAAIVQVGMLNGGLWICKAAALGGGFSQGTIYGASDLGTHYFMIQRDATTNYLVFLSNDGLNWKQIASFSQAGTVARAYLQVYAPSARTISYFDFIRMFTTQTLIIGR